MTPEISKNPTTNPILNDDANTIIETRKYGDIFIYKTKNGDTTVVFNTEVKNTDSSGKNKEFFAANGNSERHTFTPKDLTVTNAGFGYLCTNGICITPKGSKTETFSPTIESRTLSDAEIIEMAKKIIQNRPHLKGVEVPDLWPEVLVTGKKLILIREGGKFIIRNPGNWTINEKNIDLPIQLDKTLKGPEAQFEIIKILFAIEKEMIARKSCIDREDLSYQIERITPLRDIKRDFVKNFVSSEINDLSKSLANGKQDVRKIWDFIYANSDQNRLV